MPVGFCSICKIEKDDSKWRNISEQGKEKAELVGYELNIGERICSKCYNSHIAHDRHNRYKKKSEDAPYKIKKPNEMEVEANTSLQNQIIELKAELEKITRPSNQHIKGILI